MKNGNKIKKMEMKLLIGLIVKFVPIFHFHFPRARSPLPFLHFRRDFRRRRKRERQKSNRLSRQNNNSARAARFLVNFVAVTA